MSYDEDEAKRFAASMDATIYYVFLFKKGPNRRADATLDLDDLQARHLANLKRLGEMGKLALNGPLLDSFADDGDLRGIGVLKTETMQEARDLLDADPMALVGWLAYEVHAWMVGKGIIEDER
jgi:uncharacterized protein YciI